MDNADFMSGFMTGEANSRGNCYGNGWGGFGDGGFFWIFALLLLPAMFNGGGLWGNNGRGNPVTEADLCQSQSFAELKNSVGRINDEVAGVNTNLGNAICNLGYETLRNFNTLESQLASCCCETQRILLENRYIAQQDTAATNANITAQIQSVKDMLCAQEAARKDARIWQLELNQAMYGVVRYPNQTTFATACNPFFGSWGCGGGCGNNNI